MSNARPSKSYTVSQLATLSGVSVRALHHYDEIGLLKPASVGLNGYRYYGREELLRLQQILFHRELGLSLDEIRRAMNTPGFDRAAALRHQRQKLVTEIARMRQLIKTIDQTLSDLEGHNTMNDKSMYRGFDAQARERSEAWAVERYGKWARLGIETRNEVTQNWTQAEREAHWREMETIFSDFAAAASQGLTADSDRTQEIVLRLHSEASKSWTGPIGRGGFINLAEFYAENPDSRTALDGRAPGLADYVARAIRIFCVETDPWPGAAKATAAASARP
jgi:MerR family transcriptional regulator, thiopeptide resistance regulator